MNQLKTLKLDLRGFDMKTTVIPKAVTAQPITNLQDLEPGTVVTLSGGSIKALVITSHIKRNNVLVLLSNVGGDWFSEPGGWHDMPIEVVGKLIEIIVEEI